MLGWLSLTSVAPLSIDKILFVFAVSLLAIAAGRIIAIIIERPTHRSYIFLIIETILGGVAIYGYIS